MTACLHHLAAFRPAVTIDAHRVPTADYPALDVLEPEASLPTQARPLRPSHGPGPPTVETGLLPVNDPSLLGQTYSPRWLVRDPSVDIPAVADSHQVDGLTIRVEAVEHPELPPPQRPDALGFAW